MFRIQLPRRIIGWNLPRLSKICKIFFASFSIISETIEFHSKLGEFCEKLGEFPVANKK